MTWIILLTLGSVVAGWSALAAAALYEEQLRPGWMWFAFALMAAGLAMAGLAGAASQSGSQGHRDHAPDHGADVSRVGSFNHHNIGDS